MKQASTLLFLIVLSSTLIGQTVQKSPTVNWEHTYGLRKPDKINKTIFNYKGTYTSVGDTENRSEGGKDIYLLIVDREGTVELEKTIGDTGDDEGRSIENAIDGGYYIVGYTNSSALARYGKKDAIILRVDENGTTLWLEILGTDEDDVINDIKLGSDGLLYFTGEKKNVLWAGAYDPQQQALIWEYQMGYVDPDPSTGAALVLDDNNNLIISGSIEKGRNKQATLLKLDKNGNVLFDKYIDEEVFVQYKAVNISGKIYDLEGTDLIITREGNYAVVGNANTERYNSDVALILFSPDGTPIYTRLYGSRWDDYANSIEVDYSNHLFIAGRSVEERGDTKYKAQLFRVSAEDEGQRIWKNTIFYGTKQNDVFYDLLFSPGGEILLSGVNRDKRAWMISLKSEGYPQEVPEIYGMRIDKPSLSDKDNNNVLTPLIERTTYDIPLRNVSNGDFYDVVGNIKMLDTVPGLIHPSSVALGNLPSGGTKEMRIPFFVNDEASEGTVRFSVELKSGIYTYLNDTIFTIDVIRDPKPNLVLANPKFIPRSGNIIDRGIPILLEVDIINEGNARAEEVQVAFFTADGIETINQENNQGKIGSLQPNERKRVSVEFVTSSTFPDDILSINCITREAQDKFGDEKTFPTTIGKLALNFPDLPEDLKADEVAMAWPLNYENQEVTLAKALFDNSIKLQSASAINAEDLQILVNDEVNTAVIKSLVPERTSRIFTYELILKNLPVKLGRNTVKVQSKSSVSDPFIINYEPKQGNLYVYSFGVSLPNQDSSLMHNNAEAFAKVFSQQKGVFYNQIFINTFTGEDNTSSRKIRNILYNEIYDQVWQNKFKPEDMIVVYIASLASNKTVGNFRIKCSDYNGYYDLPTSLAYSDLELFMNPLNCKKLLVLDVLLDRNYEEQETDVTLSNSVIPYVEKQSTFPTIVPCQLGELAYTNQSDAKSAFVQSFEDLLNPINKNEIDKNIDRLISLNELFQFLTGRISNILSLKNPPVPTKQTPYLKSEFMEKDFGILEFTGNE
ncbi:MAG: hypothetical protein AAFO07_01075 [Bacteroidota bacterium]